MLERNGPSSQLAVPNWAQREWLWMGLLFVSLVSLQGAILLYDHSLNSIDGAMQTWFALDNFADGAKLGEDFQSYLGVTMILSLLPGFVAFGQTLWASTFAAYAMVMLGCFAGAYAIVWMLRPIPPRLRWLWTVMLVCLFYYVGALAKEAVGLSNPATFDPGVSLRPLRGALPFFILPVFVWALDRVRAAETSVPALWLGLIAGVGALWSNDAGIPLVIASLAALVLGIGKRIWLIAKVIFAFAIGASTSIFGVLMLVTQGNPSGWIEYNFTHVAGDQFWYFGPWDRDSRVLSILDLPNIFFSSISLTSISLILLAVCAVYAVVRRIRGRGAPVRLSAFIFVSASILGTATLPQIGGHIGPEYNAITFVLGVCAPVIVFQRTLFSLVKPAWRQVPKVVVPVAGVVAAIAMIGLDGVTLARTVSQTDRTVYAKKLGFYVADQTAEDLAAMERLSAFLGEEGFEKNRRLLSVYTSALDIAAGTKSPAPVGSLIHALGETNRSDHNALLFGKTVAVTTIAPDYTGWAGWNTRANWSFFKNLRDLYRPIGRTDQQILWIRVGNSVPTQQIQCKVTDWEFDTFTVSLDGEHSGTASVFIEREGFDTSSRTAALIVHESSPLTRSASKPQWSDFPRYGVPNTRMVEVSAPVEASEQTQLTFEVMDGSSIGWGSCFARVYDPIDFDDLPSLSKGVDDLIKAVGS